VLSSADRLVWDCSDVMSPSALEPRGTCPTSREVAGSIPDGVIGLLNKSKSKVKLSP
jgi:hypothetical protein